MTAFPGKPRSAFEVLVIDDDPGEKPLVKEILEQQGFTVTWCEGWQDVEKLLWQRAQDQASLPDVALVDMHFARPTLGVVPSREAC